MLAFYMDHHVQAAITEGLRVRGVDVLTAFEDGAADWSDERILDHATELGRVVVTTDQDFLRLAREYGKSGRNFAGVVFAAQRDLEIGQMVLDLELMAHAVSDKELANRVEFLPL
jgi:predicted nuclease of predicted toxin-antitoxin system